MNRPLCSEFKDIFDLKIFTNSLQEDVNIVEALPPHLAKIEPVTKAPISWSKVILLLLFTFLQFMSAFGSQIFFLFLTVCGNFVSCGGGIISASDSLFMFFTKQAPYYEKELVPLLKESKVLYFTHADSRLANNDLPDYIQQLRCRVNYRALKYSEPIRQLADTLTNRMREDSPYLALHLRCVYFAL